VANQQSDASIWTLAIQKTQMDDQVVRSSVHQQRRTALMIWGGACECTKLILMYHFFRFLTEE